MINIDFRHHDSSMSLDQEKGKKGSTRELPIGGEVMKKGDDKITLKV